MGKTISANLGNNSAESGIIFNAFTITLQLKQLSSIILNLYNFIVYENKNCFNCIRTVPYCFDIGATATYQRRSSQNDEQC